MFANRTRLFIGFIFFLSLLLLVYLRQYMFASVALMFIVLLAWDYIRQGTLIVAARYFHHKNYDKAERTLLEIFNPQWLSKTAVVIMNF
jgi:hypothetical protein